MIQERSSGSKVLICDCCGRQIIDHVSDDRYTVGPREGTRKIGVNKHACRVCFPEWKEWAEWNEKRLQ